MNQQERDALREKHRPHNLFNSETECFDGCNSPYPCDVIKMLDAWEAKCDHYYGLGSDETERYLSEYPLNPEDLDVAFTFCPKCGEKL